MGPSPCSKPASVWAPFSMDPQVLPGRALLQHRLPMGSQLSQASPALPWCPPGAAGKTQLPGSSDASPGVVYPGIFGEPQLPPLEQVLAFFQPCPWSLQSSPRHSHSSLVQLQWGSFGGFFPSSYLSYPRGAATVPAGLSQHWVFPGASWNWLHQTLVQPLTEPIPRASPSPSQTPNTTEG